MTLKSITMRVLPAAVAVSIALLPFGAAEAWGGYGGYSYYSYPSYSSASASASASSYGYGSSASASSAASAYAATPMYYGGGYYSGYSGYYGYGGSSPSYAAPENLCAYNASQFECDYTYNITNNYNSYTPSHQNSYSGWYGW